jgi:hypothetical protein
MKFESWILPEVIDKTSKIKKLSIYKKANFEVPHPSDTRVEVKYIDNIDSEKSTRKQSTRVKRQQVDIEKEFNIYYEEAPRINFHYQGQVYFGRVEKFFHIEDPVTTLYHEDWCEKKQTLNTAIFRLLVRNLKYPYALAVEKILPTNKSEVKVDWLPCTRFR